MRSLTFSIAGAFAYEFERKSSSSLFQNSRKSIKKSNDCLIWPRKHHCVDAKQIKTTDSRFGDAVRITDTRWALSGSSSRRVGESMRCSTLPDGILSDRMKTLLLNLSNLNQNCDWSPWRDYSSSRLGLVIPLKSEPNLNRTARSTCGLPALPFVVNPAECRKKRMILIIFAFHGVSRSGQSSSCGIQQVANWACFDHRVVRESSQRLIDTQPRAGCPKCRRLIWAEGSRLEVGRIRLVLVSWNDHPVRQKSLNVVAHSVCSPFHRQRPIHGRSSVAVIHLTDALKYNFYIEREEWKRTKRRKRQKGERRSERCWNE
jgi:hypothetical protein